MNKSKDVDISADMFEVVISKFLKIDLDRIVKDFEERFDGLSLDITELKSMGYYRVDSNVASGMMTAEIEFGNGVKKRVATMTIIRVHNRLLFFAYHEPYENHTSLLNARKQTNQFASKLQRVTR